MAVAPQLAGTDLLLLLLKHSLTVVLVLLIVRLRPRASAAQIVFAVRCGLIALLLMPLFWFLLPGLPLRLPWAWTALMDPPLSLPEMNWLAQVPEQSVAFATPRRAMDIGRLCLMLYAIPVLWHVLRIALQLWHLHRIARFATKVEAAAWRDALCQLQQQFGLKREVRLLVSNRLAAPISWGWRAPVIVIDANSLENTAPSAILAHELAHIANDDWLTLMLARCLLALYWWHPLMYLLLRQLEHHTECAADDAVLATGLPPSQYAQTLVMVSRHAFAPPLVSQAIASRGSSLLARINALLEQRRSRVHVSLHQWLTGAAVTGILVAALGSLMLRGEHVVWPDELIESADTPVSLASGDSIPKWLETLDNPNFRQLAQAMRAQDFGQRHAKQVASFRQRAAIPPLIWALQDPRPVIRRLALWGLSEMRFPETAPAVAALLKDPAPEVRAEAAGALGDMDEARWILPMLAMLRDPDPRVRQSVAHALGDLRERVSIAALQAARDDSDPAVASEVAWALREMP